MDPIPARSLRRIIAAAAATFALLPCAGAAAQQASPGCQQPPPAARSFLNLAVDGLDRSALVVVPAGAPAQRPLPLVLMFGGAGSNPLWTESSTGMTAAAAQRGFIVAYPGQLGSYWHMTDDSRDVAFASDLLDQIEAIACVDVSRVYAAGGSNGATFISRLACELSPRLAGIAAVAGDYGVQPICDPPPAPLSVLEIHGTNDGSVPYGGTFDSQVSVLEWLSQWAQWDGCRRQPLVWHRLAPRALLAAQTSCAKGTSVVHIKLLGQHHAWPSISRGGVLTGRLVRFSATQAIMQFFGNGHVTIPAAGAAPLPARKQRAAHR